MAARAQAKASAKAGPRARATGRRPLVLAAEAIAVAVLGLLLGSGLAVLGEALLPPGPLVSAIVRTWPVGLDPPGRLDLVVLSITAGGTIRLGPLSVVGAIAGLWLLWTRRR